MVILPSDNSDHFYSATFMEATMWLTLVYAACYIRYVLGNITLISSEDVIENKRIETLVNLISQNIKPNGWTNLHSVGTLPDAFYAKIKNLHLTQTVADVENDEHEIEDAVPYASNVIIINSKDFDEFETALMKAMGSPYWHPHSHIIIYYQSRELSEFPKIFYILWFYKACNAIILQCDDSKETLMITVYSPYISENYRLSNLWGCWKAKKVGMPIISFRESFVCEEGCHNVSLHSKLRAIHIGTCIGFETYSVRYQDSHTIKSLNIFQDKGKNLHGSVLRAYATEILPFLEIREHNNDTYSLHARDGLIWNTVSERMNFRIDLNVSKTTMKQPFHFEVNVQQIYDFGQRQVDLVLFPIYQFDIIIVELDLTVAFKDSGVCILAHRAGFDTILFDINILLRNFDLFLKFVFCFVCILVLFFVFNIVDGGKCSFDQLGRAFLNTIRNCLSISLYKPPRHGTFRIFLVVSIWSFFIINFVIQAAIISFFSAYKRGKDVDTFEDVIEKGYNMEGMASPDMVLPETEERFVKINSKLVSVPSLFDCVNNMANDSHRFCLIDCSVGRYLARNRLNEKGQQYLHIAKDRIHSHYLTMMFHKHSPLTTTFNKIIRRCIEAGLIKKWEEYRYANIKEEAPIKPLSLDDLIGIFKCYCLCLGLSSAVFLVEIAIGIAKQIKHYFMVKIYKWKRTRASQMKLKLERKLGKIKRAHQSTQTVLEM